LRDKWGEEILDIELHVDVHSKYGTARPESVLVANVPAFRMLGNRQIHDDDQRAVRQFLREMKALYPKPDSNDRPRQQLQHAR
jgi:hypothetical protein